MDSNFLDFMRNIHIERASSTCLAQSDRIEYLRPGLKSEVGELYGVIKKIYREPGDEKIKGLFLTEIGDVIWYIANMMRLLETCSNKIEYIDDVSITIIYIDIRKSMIKDKASFSDYAEDLAEYAETLVDRMMELSIFFSRNTSRLDILKDIIIKVIALCAFVDVDIFDSMDYNYEKLCNRKKNNVICGKGETRI